MDYFTGPIAITAFIAGAIIQLVGLTILIGDEHDSWKYFNSFDSKLTGGLGIAVSILSIASTIAIFDSLNIESRLFLMFAFAWVSVFHVFNAKVAEFLFSGNIFRFIPADFSKWFPGIVQIHYMIFQVWILATVLSS